MNNKAQTMKKKSKRTRTPKLRFPEFRNKLGWEEKKLSEITSAVFDGTHQTPTYTEAGIAFYSVENLVSGSANKFISKEDHDLATRKNKPEKGDILLTRIGKIGFSQVVSWDHEFSIYVTLAVIKRSSQFNSHYLHCLMQSDSYQTELRSKSLSNAVPPKINMDSLRDTKVLLPSSEEQQKIADCLSSLDAWIAAEGRKLEALKAHKKGLMQQLFPQPGETTPRLRFPEFRDKGEWEEKRMEEIGRVIRGSSPRPQGDSRYFNGPVPRLMVQDVTRDGKWVTPRTDSLTEEGAKLSRPCPAGTLTIVCSGTVGVVSFLAVDACIHDGFLAIIDIDDRITSEDFLFHALSTLREQFEKGATHGGVFTNLTTAGIKEFKILCPAPAEQQRVAGCLTSLDARIAVQAARIDALKQHKRGLMQQLFPGPELL